METSSSPVHRSNNTTPHHHYYSSEQPRSFTNSLINNSSQVNHLNHHLINGENVSRENIRRTTPRLYTPTNVSSGGRKNRSRNESPSVHSIGGGSNSNIMMPLDLDLDSSLSPALLSRHIHHHMNSNDRLNSSGTNSNSITPPNSNSNTTISCGSGNSTSANIGVPTTPKSTLNHNNNHIKRQTDLENVRNNKNTSPRPKAKKCILEEGDEDVEKGVKNKKGTRIRTSWVGPNQEFLPICDALFNVISLAAYFCDIVFDVLTAYTWYKLSQGSGNEFTNHEISQEEMKQQDFMWKLSVVALIFIGLSTFLTQTLSFKWYKQSARRGQIGPDGVELEGPPTPCSTSVLVLMHLSLCGVLWRYFKLFIPVDLRFVKNEVRDLCLLRLVHAFCEAVPMLLIQLYLIWGLPGPESVSDFTIVSTSLSLFSVCWALASFSKNIRKQNVHKLVLTWLGVIFQFLWHLGTVISRVVALSLYATVYQFWVFLVLILHWFCVLMWLISPKNLYHGEKISTFRKVIYSTLIAVVYTFCYVNVQESNSRQKVVIYYVTMFLENTLLLSVWLIAKRYEDEIWYKNHVICAVFVCFAGGIFFMCLYYQYFHLKRLSYVYDTGSSIYQSSSALSSSVHINGAIYSSPDGKSRRGVNDTSASSGIELSLSGSGGTNNNKNLINGVNSQNNGDVGERIPNGVLKKKVPERYNKRNGSAGSNNHDKSGSAGATTAAKSDKIGGNVGGQRGALYNKINGHHIHHPNVQGVFNCRFHPAMKRKKKKPTSFVPVPLPPAVQQQTSSPPTSATTTNGPTNNLKTQLLLLGNSHERNPMQQHRLDETHVQQFLENHHQNSTFRGQSDHNNGDNSHINNDHNNDLRNMSPAYMNGSAGQEPNFGPTGSPFNGKLPILFPTSNNNGHTATPTSVPATNGGRMAVPFWKRPLSITFGSENEGSVGSRVDIQQKLQEKKQQQLAELREIEEEIKLGKLKRPQFNEIPQPVTVRQPIPVEKKQPWFRTHGYQGDEYEEDDRHMLPPLVHHRPPYLIPTPMDSNSNEVILDPQYLMYASPNLDGSDCCYYDNADWPSNYYEPVYQNGELNPSGGSGGGCSGGIQRRRKNANRSSKESIYKSYRIHSDIDSQMSLPRSYTLPREFKYKRKFRKPIKQEQFLPSTNSSDGDVDSGEEDPEIYSNLRPYPFPLPSMHHVHNNGNSIMPTTSSSAPQPSKKQPFSRRNKLHETKL